MKGDGTNLRHHSSRAYRAAGHREPHPVAARQCLPDLHINRSGDDSDRPSTYTEYAARRCKQAQIMEETAPIFEIVFDILIKSPVKEILGCLCRFVPSIRHPTRAESRVGFTGRRIALYAHRASVHPK